MLTWIAAARTHFAMTPQTGFGMSSPHPVLPLPNRPLRLGRRLGERVFLPYFRLSRAIRLDVSQRLPPIAWTSE